MGPLPGVYELVLPEGSAVSEGLPAETATVRAFAGVSPLMDQIALSARKGLLADLALKPWSRAMHPGVLPQTLSAGKILAAFAAIIRGDSLVLCQPMRIEELLSIESVRANLASERLLAVYPHVALELLFGGEALVTIGADPACCPVSFVVRISGPARRWS